MRVDLNTTADYGRVIRDARVRAGLSQAALARRLGTTQSWISEVENGKATAEIGRVIQVLSFLKVNLTAEIRDRPQPSPQEEDDFPDLDEIINSGMRP